VWIGIYDTQRNFATYMGGDDALQLGVLTTRCADWVCHWGHPQTAPVEFQSSV